MEYRPLGAGANLDNRRVEREYGLCVNCYSSTWWPLDIELFKSCDGEQEAIYSRRRRLRLCRACYDFW